MLVQLSALIDQLNFIIVPLTIFLASHHLQRCRFVRTQGKRGLGLQTRFRISHKHPSSCNRLLFRHYHAPWKNPISVCEAFHNGYIKWGDCQALFSLIRINLKYLASYGRVARWVLNLFFSLPSITWPQMQELGRHTSFPSLHAWQVSTE